MSRRARWHVAVDLGASSGRVVAGSFGADGLRFREAHRFHHVTRHDDGTTRWDLAQIQAELLQGLHRAGALVEATGGTVASVGVDSWGVDYAWTSNDGVPVAAPVCYRDAARDDWAAAVHAAVPREELFARTGIQHLPFNTIYRVAADIRHGLPRGAERFLQIADLCHVALGAPPVGEQTNASTTALLDPVARTWDGDLLRRLGIPPAVCPPLVTAGTVLGPLTDPLLPKALRRDTLIVAPATHDTGSAVLGTPLTPGWAYISSGTWSLVGLERRDPVRTPGALAANVTNEAGAYGTVRLLKNVMGLWILNRCREEWDEAGHDLGEVGALASGDLAPPPLGVTVDPDDRRFFNPPRMESVMKSALREAGHDVSERPVVLAQVVLESLAARYAGVLRCLAELTGEPIQGVHIVGGGSGHAWLNQATADATGLPVRAGPVEATALGNLTAQALALGVLPSPEAARDYLRLHIPTRSWLPRETRDVARQGTSR